MYVYFEPCAWRAFRRRGGVVWPPLNKAKNNRKAGRPRALRPVEIIGANA